MRNIFAYPTTIAGHTLSPGAVWDPHWLINHGIDPFTYQPFEKGKGMYSRPIGEIL
jgi:hypothetical protein